MHKHGQAVLLSDALRITGEVNEDFPRFSGAWLLGPGCPLSWRAVPALSTCSTLPLGVQTSAPSPPCPPCAAGQVLEPVHRAQVIWCLLVSGLEANSMMEGAGFPLTASCRRNQGAGPGSALSALPYTASRASNSSARLLVAQLVFWSHAGQQGTATCMAALGDLPHCSPGDQLAAPLCPAPFCRAGAVCSGFLAGL